MLSAAQRYRRAEDKVYTEDTETGPSLLCSSPAAEPQWGTAQGTQGRATLQVWAVGQQPLILSRVPWALEKTPKAQTHGRHGNHGGRSGRSELKVLKHVLSVSSI